MSGAVLRTDGGSRGNPGPAGAGFVIERDGEIICRARPVPRLADQQRGRVRGADLGSRERLGAGLRRGDRVRGQRTAGQADQRPVPGEERGTQAALHQDVAAAAGRSRRGRSSTFAANRTPRPTPWPTRRWTRADDRWRPGVRARAAARKTHSSSARESAHVRTHGQVALRCRARAARLSRRVPKPARPHLGRRGDGCRRDTGRDRYRLRLQGAQGRPERGAGRSTTTPTSTTCRRSTC